MHDCVANGRLKRKKCGNVRVPPPQHTQTVSLELMVASVSRVSRESDVGGHNDRDSDGRKRTVLRMDIAAFLSDGHDASVSFRSRV